MHPVMEPLPGRAAMNADPNMAVGEVLILKVVIQTVMLLSRHLPPGTGSRKVGRGSHREM